MAQAPFPGQPGYPGGPSAGGGGNKPPNPYDPEAPSTGPYTTQVINGIQYTYDRNGNLVDVRAVPGAGAGGGGGARGATPEELALSYAKLEQDQRQWEAELLAAQAKGDADRAQRAQEHLDNLSLQRDELDRKYADSAAGREFQGRENEFDRQFQQARDEARYEFEGTENEKNRALDQFMQDDQQAFQGGENAADRELRLQMQANDLGFSREELAFEKERFAATHELNRQRAGLAAARQFADVISSTDPAALDAFLAAGGGNISNALAGGATALSENALLPAAMTLRTARQMGAPVGAGLETQGLYGAGGGVGLAAGGGYARGGAPSGPAYAPAGGEAALPTVYPGAPSAADFMAQRAAANASLGGGAVAPGVAGAVTPGQKQLVAGGAYVPRRFIPAQQGFEGVVDRPTTFLTGEGGRPERVQVQPLRTQAQTQADTAGTPPTASAARRGTANVLPPGYAARLAARAAQSPLATPAEDLEARQQQAIERFQAMLQQAQAFGGEGGVVSAFDPSSKFAQLGGQFQPGPLPTQWGAAPVGAAPQPTVTRQQEQPAGLAGLYQRQPWEWALESPYGQGVGQPIFAQRGYRGVVNQPTPVVAGEGYQPERVSIQPAGAAPIGAGPTQGDGLPSLLGQYGPEMGEVRRLREGVQFGNINTFDVKSRLIDPVLFERFLRGRQTKYGIPLRSQVHEINRYQLAGTRRGTRQGY